MDLKSNKGHNGTLVTDDHIISKHSVMEAIEGDLHMNEVAATIPTIPTSHDQRPVIINSEHAVNSSEFQSHAIVPDPNTQQTVQATSQPSLIGTQVFTSQEAVESCTTYPKLVDTSQEQPTTSSSIQCITQTNILQSKINTQQPLTYRVSASIPSNSTSQAQFQTSPYLTSQAQFQTSPYLTTQSQVNRQQSQLNKSNSSTEAIYSSKSQTNPVFSLSSQHTNRSYSQALSAGGNQVFSSPRANPGYIQSSSKQLANTHSQYLSNFPGFSYAQSSINSSNFNLLPLYNNGNSSQTQRTRLGAQVYRKQLPPNSTTVATADIHNYPSTKDALALNVKDNPTEVSKPQRHTISLGNVSKHDRATFPQPSSIPNASTVKSSASIPNPQISSQISQSQVFTVSNATPCSVSSSHSIATADLASYKSISPVSVPHQGQLEGPLLQDEALKIQNSSAYHNITAPFQNTPPSYSRLKRSLSVQQDGSILKRRHPPKLKLNTGISANLGNTASTESNLATSLDSTDSRLATLPTNPTDEVLLSPSTPAFIDTDFNKDLFAEAEQQLADMQTSNVPLLDLSEIMDLSTSGELPITSPSMSDVPAPQAQVPITSSAVPPTTTHSQAIPQIQPQITTMQPKPNPLAQIHVQQKQAQNIPQAAGALIRHNLIVQQCPVQSVTPQQVLPLSIGQTQLSQAHPNISQPKILRAPFNQQQVLQSNIAQLSQPISPAQITQAQLSQARITQLSQAQLSQIAQQVRLANGAIHLSQPGTPGTLSQSQLRPLSPAQALSLIRPQQMTAVSLSMLAQTQPASTITTGTHPQATIINMNTSLAGATLISQPIQMLSSQGYPQMMSMPLQFTGAAGQGSTVLMPLQPQAGSMLQQVPQVINTTNLPKGFQPRPATVLTLPSKVPVSKGAKATVITTLATTIPSAPLTLPVTSLGMVNRAQVATPICGQGIRGPNVRHPQVLNIPQLHLATRPATQIQAVRTGDQRPMFVLQQPLCSPDKMGALAKIRPRDKQSLNSTDGKVVGISSQGHVQVTQMGGTVLLTQPATPQDTQIRVPTCVTSPVKIAKMPQIENVPLNLDTKFVPTSSSSSIKQVPSQKSSKSPKQREGDLKISPSPKQSHIKVKEETVAKSEAETNIGSVAMEYDDPDFVWEDFLEDTGAESAPATSFAHVECSLESGIQKGMRVEVTRNLGEDAYWVAAIVMTCGPLLRLRYEGYEESGTKDFWLDVGSPDMHVVGWGASVCRKLQPPEGLQEKIGEDLAGFIDKRLHGSTIVPAYLLDSSHGLTPVDQMKPGQRLEVQHELAPESVWVVRFLENVGGRLLLRYEGTDKSQYDFWLFYLHHRLHPIGWAKDNDCIYKPPEALLSEHENYSEWSEILQAALKEAFENNVPKGVFKDQEDVGIHSFQEGWRLEALHPQHRCQVSPATVVRVTTQHFIVQMDSVLPDGDSPSKRIQFCCHTKSGDIFPVHWCEMNGIRLTPPAGWKKAEFNWDDYLKENHAVAASESAFNNVWPEHEFARNQKLEAVNPAKPGQICAATVSRIISHMMWLHLDSCPNMMANHMVPITSQEIFPIGWCASNGYPLKPPRKSCFRKPVKKVAVVQPDRRTDGPMSADEYRNATYSQIKAGDAGSSWCPKIYFNHKCFSGPFLSKGRIAELPRCVGPGPIPLVLKEVMSMLINVAYKSSRVLRELQLDGTPDANMVSQTLKAKYKGKSYCAVVELCRTTGQIEQFCRQVCIKLECCPNLFSANFVNGNCPENCQQLTKTKYTCYYGKKKKRKIGRPPGGHSNLENGAIKLGRRRRKRRMNLMVKKKAALGFPPDTAQNADGEAEVDDVFEDDKSWRSTGSSLGQNDLDAELLLAKKKRKYEHRTLPPSIIKTRGAKLPKYSFERRTHKKIMLSPAPAGRNRPNLQHTSAIVMSPKKEPLYADEEIPKLESNPLTWSVMDVVRFIKTTDCAHLARLFRDQAIDGQALLLLTLPAVQDHLELKLGPAIKLCHHIEQVKIAFYEQFAK